MSSRRTLKQPSIRIAQKKKKNIPPKRGFVVGQTPIAVHSSTANNIPYERELITAPYMAMYEPVRADVAGEGDSGEAESSKDDSDGEDNAYMAISEVNTGSDSDWNDETDEEQAAVKDKRKARAIGV